MLKLLKYIITYVMRMDHVIIPNDTRCFIDIFSEIHLIENISLVYYIDIQFIFILTLFNLLVAHFTHKKVVKFL